MGAIRRSKNLEVVHQIVERQWMNRSDDSIQCAVLNRAVYLLVCNAWLFVGHSHLPLFIIVGANISSAICMTIDRNVCKLLHFEEMDQNIFMSKIGFFFLECKSFWEVFAHIPFLFIFKPVQRIIWHPWSAKFPFTWAMDKKTDNATRIKTRT